MFLFQQNATNATATMKTAAYSSFNRSEIGKALTETELQKGAQTVLNPQVHSIQFGQAGCKPKLDQEKMDINCAVSGTLKFDYKPLNLDPPTVSAVHGLEFTFVANKTSTCLHAASNCTTSVLITEFVESSSNAGTVSKEIQKAKPDATQGEKDECKTKISVLLANEVPMFLRKVVLAFFG